MLVRLLVEFIAGPMMETLLLRSTSVTSLCDALVVHIIGEAWSLDAHHLTWTLGIGENDEPGYSWFGKVQRTSSSDSLKHHDSRMAQFKPKEIVEPGGDGLGEDGQLDSGGQALTVYDRTGPAGNEYYELVKTEALAQFWG